ncbi:hypothetical protein BC829DRAFT_415293 [Chytridium lagenaria]|nr:hypothetical protein BC829DRAFT_415293 [Chytridium lagenaria]
MDKNGEVQRQQLQNTYDDDYDGSGSPEEPTYSDDDDEPTQIEEMMEVDALNEDSNRSQRLSRRYVRMVDRSTAARGDTSNENTVTDPIQTLFWRLLLLLLLFLFLFLFPLKLTFLFKSMTNSFFRRHWEHLVQTADNMSRKINAGILLLATYPGAMAAKAYTSPGFQRHVPVYQRIQQFIPQYTAFYCSSFGIRELKRLNDRYIVGVGGSNLQTAAAQNDSLQLMMHENNAIQRTMISNFTFLHKVQDEMKDSFEASLLSFKNILDEFDKKLTDIAEKLDSSFESGSGSGLPPLNTKLFLITAVLHHTHRRLADPNALEISKLFSQKTKKDSTYF